MDWAYFREQVLIDFTNERRFYKDWYNTVVGFVSKNLFKGIKNSTFDILIKRLKSTPAPDKTEMAERCHLFYGDRELLRLYFEAMTTEDQTFLIKLVKEVVVPYKEAKLYFGEDLFKESANFASLKIECKDKFRIWTMFIISEGLDYGFRSEDLTTKIKRLRVCFALPAFMQKALADALLSDQEKEIQPFELPKNWLQFHTEVPIFQELPAIKAMIQQGQLKLTLDDYINMASIKGFQKKLKLQTFPDGPAYFRAYLMANLLHGTPKHYPFTDLADTIQSIFLSPNFFETIIEAVVAPIQGVRKLNEMYLHPEALGEVFSILKHLPQGMWTSLDAIIQYAELNLFRIDPLDNYVLNQLSLDHNSPDHMSFTYGSYLQKQKVIRKRLITNAMLSAAAFGLLDLAYDKEYPNINYYNQSLQQDVNFSACRLTSLGAYVFQQKDGDTYHVPTNVERIHFELAPDSLKITVKGNMQIAVELLKNWTAPLNHDQLVFSGQKIIHNAKTTADLIKSIHQFIKSIQIPLPDYWKLEIMALLDRSKSIQQVSNLLVFKLSPDNHLLHRLFVQDAVLKNIIQKAADYTIIVETSHLEVFTDRLADLGYLPHFSNNTALSQISFDAVKPTAKELLASFETTFAS